VICLAFWACGSQIYDMTTATDVADVFESIAPQEIGVPGDQLGFLYGDPTTSVSGVACLWNIHTMSLAECAERGLNMLICHEGIWMPEQTSPWYDAPEPQHIHANVARRALLDEHEFVVYRSHSNWDALTVDGVRDQAIAALGIDGLRPIAERKFFSVLELPAPLSVTDLLRLAESGLGYSGCRVFGDAEKQIRRFSFLIGGFGENQFHMPQVARDLGAEAVIIGEMSEFIVISCLEMGLPVIETLHSVSEIPAIRRQADLLTERLPDLRVEYVPSGATAFHQP
jgi:putative NIF3 family GTP cyclohydrolase 1 type 2